MNTATSFNCILSLSMCTLLVFLISSLGVSTIVAYPLQQSSSVSDNHNNQMLVEEGGPLSIPMSPHHYINSDNGPLVGPGGKSDLQTLEDLRMRLYLLSWLQNLTKDPILNERVMAKRTCLVNAGLSHSCDYKNALAAIQEKAFFDSDQSPGRK